MEWLSAAIIAMDSFLAQMAADHIIRLDFQLEPCLNYYTLHLQNVDVATPLVAWQFYQPCDFLKLNSMYVMSQ